MCLLYKRSVEMKERKSFVFLIYLFSCYSFIYFQPYDINITSSSNYSYISPSSSNSSSPSSPSSISSYYYSNISLQYLAITGKEMFSRIEIVWNTWGKTIKKGNFLILSDSLHDNNNSKNEIPIIQVMNISNSISSHLKYRLTQLKWLYGIQLMKNKEFDWLVFLDDDTFIIHNSLKLLLSHYNSSISFLIGKAGEPSCHLVCGGAGFAMSKSLVSKLNNEFYTQFSKEYHSIIHSNSSFYHSDVIISNFIHKHKIGSIIHREEFKNFPPEVGMKWYQLHNRTPSTVVSYHRLTFEQYKLFYSIYYNTSKISS